jgi:hypothetical protein
MRGRLCIVRGSCVCVCVQCVDRLSICLNGHAYGTTACDIDTNPTHARASGGLGERGELASKCSQGDRTGGVNYPELQEVTTMGDGRLESERPEGALTSVSSYSSVQSSRVGRLSVSSAGTSLSRASCAEAEPPEVPYF